MSVTGIAVNCADVDRSVAFYEDHLGATTVERSRQGAVLEIDGGRIELLALPPGAQAWDIPLTDDHAQGFWHIGLWVDAVDPIADAVRNAGFGFFIEPVDVVLAGVRVAFFYDPDGVVIELVEGELAYTQVVDEDAARARRSLPRRGLARFDHVAFTTPTWHDTKASWESVGFTVIGTLALADDPRGGLLYYLSDGSDLVIEVFTFDDVVGPGRPADLARGFAGLLIPSPPRDALSLMPVGKSLDGRTRLSDPRGLSVIAAR